MHNVQISYTICYVWNVDIRHLKEGWMTVTRLKWGEGHMKVLLPFDEHFSAVTPNNELMGGL